MKPQHGLLTLLLVPTSQVLDEIAEHGIRIYQLPDADSDEDEEFKEQTRVLKVREGHTADASCFDSRAAVSFCWFTDTPLSSHSPFLPFTGTALLIPFNFPHVFPCPFL